MTPLLIGQNRAEEAGPGQRLLLGEERRNRVYCAQAILDVLEDLP